MAKQKKKTTAAITKRAIDSEDSRKRATRVISYHEGTLIGANMTVMNALACGVQLMKAKEELPHGEFMKWRKKYVGESVSSRTLDNYLALSKGLNKQLGSKFATVANLLDVDPADVPDDYAKKIMPRINKVLEGKSLGQLYQHLGIGKPRQTKDVKHKKKMGPSSGDAKTDAKARARDWAGETIVKLKAARTFGEHINGKELSTLITAMINAAAEMGVPLYTEKGGK